MSPGRERLDVLLVARGLAESREKAQRLIRAGLVYTESEKLDKPGRTVPIDIELRIKGSDCPYVSRGGLKLAGALDTFAVDPTDRVALDLGASTGGFTDCLLQRSARLVHAIDVGTNQLHEKLRACPRVLSREQTHLDALEAAEFPEPPTLAVADLSFISLRRAYPVLKRVMLAGGDAILLVKPQFEAGRESVPRGGVVTDPAVHARVMEELTAAAVEAGLEVIGACPSPITGGDGNREFFLHLRVPHGEP